MSTIARFSLPQYELMIEHGVFDGKYRQRVELIRGEIRQMNPIGYEHTAVVDFSTNGAFGAEPRRIGAYAFSIRFACPILAAAPEPDVVWVLRKKYTGHPTAPDALLVIEVAESSLSTDCGEKAALYAESGICDYWVVDIQGRSLIVHRAPAGNTYGDVQLLHEDASMRRFAIPRPNSEWVICSQCFEFADDPSEAL